MGVLENGRSNIELQIFLVAPSVLKSADKEPEELLENRFEAIKKYYSGGKLELAEPEISILKELFGKDFLTPQYFLDKFEFTYGK